MILVSIFFYIQMFLQLNEYSFMTLLFNVRHHIIHSQFVSSRVIFRYPGSKYKIVKSRKNLYLALQSLQSYLLCDFSSLHKKNIFLKVGCCVLETIKCMKLTSLFLNLIVITKFLSNCNKSQVTYQAVQKSAQLEREHENEETSVLISSCSVWICSSKIHFFSF